jgi:hypothetical protein
MFKFFFRLEKSSPKTIREIEKWLKENNLQPVTSDTMVKNMLEGSPHRYFKLRSQDESDRLYRIIFSHENDRLLFKLRWFDEFAECRLEYR